MDYEKKYKEALERAKNINNEHRAQPFDVMTRVFPELKESKDEKIRKEIISALKFANVKGVYDKHIAWLEKQGESDETKAKIFLINKGYPIDTNSVFPTYKEMYNIIIEGLEKQSKPTDKIEPKFKVGDWVITNKKHIWYVDETPETTSYLYRLINQYGKVEVAEYAVVNEHAHLWTIQDAKDGDVLSDGTTIFIFKELLSDGSVMSYCDYDTDSGESDAFCPLSMNLMCSKINPATKEQRDLLLQKMHDEGYEWNDGKRELKKIEQKYAWSEKDNYILHNIFDFVAEYLVDKNKRACADECLKWIKDLKERVLPQTKQEWSEEDENMLKSIIATCKLAEQDRDSSPARHLYEMQTNWLKSLKERIKGE